jgi:hypothetical protein
MFKSVHEKNKKMLQMDKDRERYRDEHWETLIINQGYEGDFSDELYDFTLEEIDYVFDKLYLIFNMYNLFNKYNGENADRREKEIYEIVVSTLTKTAGTIMVLNSVEKYEYSQRLHNNMSDLWVLSQSGYDKIDHPIVDELELEFHDVFNTTMNTLKEHKKFQRFK